MGMGFPPGMAGPYLPQHAPPPPQMLLQGMHPFMQMAHMNDAPDPTYQFAPHVSLEAFEKLMNDTVDYFTKEGMQKRNHFPDDGME